MAISDKARTNKSWTSNDRYSDSWKRIFGKKKEDKDESVHSTVEAEVDTETAAGEGTKRGS